MLISLSHYIYIYIYIYTHRSSTTTTRRSTPRSSPSSTPGSASSRPRGGTKEGQVCISVYIYIYIYIYDNTCMIYIYIYIYIHMYWVLRTPLHMRTFLFLSGRHGSKNPRFVLRPRGGTPSTRGRKARRGRPVLCYLFCYIS